MKPKIFRMLALGFWDYKRVFFEKKITPSLFGEIGTPPFFFVLSETPVMNTKLPQNRSREPHLHFQFVAASKPLTFILDSPPSYQLLRTLVYITGYSSMTISPGLTTEETLVYAILTQSYGGEHQTNGSRPVRKVLKSPIFFSKNRI